MKIGELVGLTSCMARSGATHGVVGADVALEPAAVSEPGPQL